MVRDRSANEVFSEASKRAACIAMEIASRHYLSRPSNPEGGFPQPQTLVHMPADQHGVDRL